MNKIVNKREEAITLWELTRQKNLVEWYKGINSEITTNASKKIEELEEKLLKIRKTA